MENTCEQDIGQQGQTELVRLRKQSQSQELPLTETKQVSGHISYQQGGVPWFFQADGAPTACWTKCLLPTAGKGQHL